MSRGRGDDPLDRQRLPERAIGPSLDVLVDRADGADVAAERLDGRLEFGDAGIEVVEAVRPVERFVVGERTFDGVQPALEGVAVVGRFGVVRGHAPRWPGLRTRITARGSGNVEPETHWSNVARATVRTEGQLHDLRAASLRQFLGTDSRRRSRPGWS